MIELEVQNFQSIRSASITVSGFAAIVGKSNIGKSALVRAAQYALTGAAGTDFVRHGPECDRRTKNNKKCKCFSRVIFRMAKMTVTWEKGDNVNRYTVLRADNPTPEVFNGLERGSPPFLLPDFQLVKVGDNKELIQVPDQFEPIFLLNKSGPAVADVLSDVARLDRINHAMALVTKDRKDAVAKRKVRQEDVIKLTASLAKYDGIDAVAVDPLLSALKVLKEKKALLTKIDGFITQARALKEELQGLMKALKAEIPAFETLENTSKQFGEVLRFCDEYEPLEKETRQLEKAVEPALPNNDGLEKASKALYQIARFVDTFAEMAPVIKKLIGVEKIEVPADDFQQAYKGLLDVDDLLSRSEAAEEQVALWQGSEDVEVPDLDVLQESFGKLEAILGFMGRGKTLAEAITKHNQELKDATTAEEEAVKEMAALGVCPTCDQPLGTDHHLHLEESA